MPLSLLNHSALALFAQRTRIPTSARSIGFCAIWVCNDSNSASFYLSCSRVSSLSGIADAELRAARLANVRFVTQISKV
jgi:hypothetical protein